MELYSMCCCRQCFSQISLSSGRERKYFGMILGKTQLWFCWLQEIDESLSHYSVFFRQDWSWFPPWHEELARLLLEMIILVCSDFSQNLFVVVLIPGDDNRGLGDDIKVWLVEQPTLIAPFVGLRKTFHTISCNPPSVIIASKITLFLLTRIL